jgi:hypothetical protein
MEEDLRDLLQAAAVTGTLLTPSVEVNWGSHPQGTALPGVVLNTIGGAEGYTQAGRNGLSQASVQIDVYGLVHDDVVGLAREIRDALSGFRGEGTTGFFEGIFLTATRSGREGGTNEAERPFRRSMDFDVNWRET